MGSALATLTQVTRVATTQAAKRTRIGRSVGRGYLPPPTCVKPRQIEGRLEASRWPT